MREWEAAAACAVLQLSSVVANGATTDRRSSGDVCIRIGGFFSAVLRRGNSWLVRAKLIRIKNE